ncbi:copper resistance protein CopC [Radiobacillus kanasensis]|uniref:copper resistance CopC family protein n=1 Tax=Radiobacillus kanasensis TaxID=2844358 RepID=UPI001E3FB500|nr:copper resistance CopC family protein [Radiobacillus kanasensis]UFU00323.1 copper resistance protein CopC [Radiobacillus kanasensis]
MKKVVTALVLFFLLVPTVQAHSVLVESNPAEGATIQEELTEVALTFNTKVEEGSTFTLVSTDGQEQVPTEIVVSDSTLTGTYDTPIPNGEYTVQYNVIGADGHPIEGSYSFSVAVEASEPEAEEPTESPEEETTEEESVQDEPKEKTADVEEQTASDSEESTEESTNWLPIVAIAIVIVALFVILWTSRRKSKGR